MGLFGKLEELRIVVLILLCLAVRRRSLLKMGSM